VNLALVRPLLIAALFQSASAQAAPDCTGEFSRAQAIAASISVEFQRSERLRAGEPITIKWRKPHGDLSRTPIYLVIGAPAEVRFAGSQMIALAAEARAPQGLAFATHSARAVIPLHRISTTDEGQVSVLPYKSGVQTISWAALTTGACGERVLRAGQSKVAVAIGAPELLVRDRFADENPIKRIRSLNGAFDLLVFGDRYAVYEVATGVKIIDVPGVDPNFSPSSRFVAARQVAGNFGMEIYDLIARKKIAETGRGYLAWVRGDSYLIYGEHAWGVVKIWNTFVDSPPLLDRSLSCHACGALEQVRLLFDLDRGYAFGIDSYLGAVDLVTRKVRSERIDVKEDDGPKKALQYLRREFNPALRQLPAAWDVGEKLIFSHSPDPPEDVDPDASKRNQQAKAKRAHEAGRPSAPILVQHTRMDASRPSGASAGDQLVGKPRGWLDVLQSIRTVAPRDAAFDRLAEMGLVTRGVAKLDRVYLRENYGCCEEDPRAKEISDDLRRRYPAIEFRDKASLGRFDPDRIAEILESHEKAKPSRVDDAGSSKPSAMVCTDINDDMLNPSHLAQVLHWERDGNDNWLIQSICAGGNESFGFTDFILIRGGEKPSVRILNNLLGSDLFEGRFSGQFQAEIVRLRDEIFAVNSPNTGKLLLVDIAADRPLRDPLGVPQDVELLAARLSADERNLVQLNINGDIFVYRIGDGQRVLIGKFVEGEVVLATEDGLYDTNYEGAETVQVRFLGLSGVYRFDQFEAELRRRGLVTAVLAGTPLASPPTAIAKPPSAQLTLGTTPIKGRRVGKVLVSSERPLASVRLYVDGRLAQELPVTGVHAEAAINVPDPGGGRWISAVAVDGQGASSQPSAILIPGPLRPVGKVRAIVIGVDQYTDPDLPALALAKVDARHFEEALLSTKGHLAGDVEPTLLLDRDATPQRVLEMVRSAAEATAPEDLLVFYFAGHGIDSRRQVSGGLALATTETRLSDLRSTALLWSDLGDALASAAGKVVVFLDACHSGLSGNQALATNDDLAAALLTRKGAPMVILAGSKGRQLTEENAATGGGVFTSAITAVIADTQKRNRHVDLSEFYSAIRARVMEATNGRQTPWLARNSLVGDMVLF
jgi:hypothetical protein